MPATSDDLRRELTEVIDDLHRSQQLSGYFATSLMRVATAMRTFSTHVDQRFDAVDSSIRAVDTKVGLVGDEVRKMSARQEELFGLIGRQELQGHR